MAFSQVVVVIISVPSRSLSSNFSALFLLVICVFVWLLFRGPKKTFSLLGFSQWTLPESIPFNFLVRHRLAFEPSTERDGFFRILRTSMFIQRPQAEMPNFPFGALGCGRSSESLCTGLLFKGQENQTSLFHTSPIWLSCPDFTSQKYFFRPAFSRLRKDGFLRSLLSAWPRLLLTDRVFPPPASPNPQFTTKCFIKYVMRWCATSCPVFGRSGPCSFAPGIRFIKCGLASGHCPEAGLGSWLLPRPDPGLCPGPLLSGFSTDCI